jgi:hypothetical protein
MSLPVEISSKTALVDAICVLITGGGKCRQESTFTNSTGTSSSNYDVILLWGEMILKKNGLGGFNLLPSILVTCSFVVVVGYQYRGEKRQSGARDSLLAPAVSLWQG